MITHVTFLCRHRQKKRKPKGKRARQAAFFKAQRETKKHKQERVMVKQRVQEKPKKRKKLNLDEEENEDFGIRFLVQEEKRAQQQDQKHFESIPIPNDQNFEMIDEYQYKTTSKTLILPLRHGLLPRGGGPFALPSRDEWIQDFRARFENDNDSSTKNSSSVTDKQTTKVSAKFRPMTRRKQNNGSVVLTRKPFSLFDTL